LTDPGWDKGGSFADPRPDGAGPLPEQWAHYKGLYRNASYVIFSYSIGKTDVLEMQGSVAAKEQVGFTRTLQLGKSDVPQRVLICEENAAKARLAYLNDLVLSNPTDPEMVDRTAQRASAPRVAGGVGKVAILSDAGGQTMVGIVEPAYGQLEIIGGYRIELVLPPRAEAAAVKVVIAHLPVASVATFADLMNSAAKVEDLAALCKGGPTMWNPPIVTEGKRGADDWAYTVDTVATPDNNPWKSIMRTSAFDFLPDGRAVVATMSGDVWIVSGLDDTLSHTMWKRFATGMYEPLGLKVVDGKIYVLCRDQITILHDLNNDGEADFYENYCNAWATSPIYHAFLMDLQADSQGNLYFSTCGNQAPMDLRQRNYGFIMKVPKGGKTVERYADGLRAANGMGVGPNDEIVTADNQGNWTPACRINLVEKGGFYGFYNDPRRIKKEQVPQLHLPAMYDPPICWLRYPAPDNSSGGQVWAGANWGPMSGQLLSTSYGQSNLLSVMWEKSEGVPQGGTVKLPLKFDSGIMRARVNPKDGQVWVCGLKGWQTNAAREGCLQRVRYTGKPAHLPVALHVAHDSISITFSEPVDKAEAADDQNYGIEQWNYHWSETYGSPEFKVSSPNQQGHDVVDVKTAKVSADGKTVMLQTDELKPVMQMMIQMHIKSADGAPMDWDVINTINRIAR
jgi:glucose/arabinose dehydrogenase